MGALALLLVNCVLCPSISAQTTETQLSTDQSNSQPKPASVEPCRLKRDSVAVADGAASGAIAIDPANPAIDPSLEPRSCPPIQPLIDWYARFLNGPTVKPMTPKEKAWLAVRNVVDPFNAMTIVGLGAISVAANSHSPYGPGFPGWGRYIGVSYTEDITGEFFGTFLIPSIFHQDPHYHRMPDASIPRRVYHTVEQVFWSEGDNGRSMPNYATLIGFACDDAISNLYVPGQATRFSASASRYVIALATAPIDNMITEFVPDVAKRIHVHIVLVQNIINQVARTDNNNGFLQ